MKEVTRLLPQVITPREPLEFASIGSGGEWRVCHKVFEWDLFFFLEPGAVNSPIDNARNDITSFPRCTIDCNRSSASQTRRHRSDIVHLAQMTQRAGEDREDAALKRYEGREMHDDLRSEETS